MNRLLVTGGSGLLGSCVAKIASPYFEVYATYNRHHPHVEAGKCLSLDIRDKEQVLEVVRETRPHLIIHTAALRALDYCEDHPKEAWKVNTKGAENVALATAQYSARLIHISTDSVFNGDKGLFTEQDIPNPITVYGKTKLKAEIRVQHAIADALIVRTSSIYGKSSFGQSLAEWILEQLKQSLPVKMFSDSFFSPILANNLARVLLEMYQRNLTGIYHVAGSQRCSRYDFALEVARVFELDEALVQPSNMSQAEVKLRAPRPRDSSLDITNVSREIKTLLLNVRQGVTWFKQLLEEEKS